MFGGLAAGAMIKFLAGFLGPLKSSVEYATRAGGRTWYFGTDVSPALVAVGLIVGLPVASQVFLGGALGWYVLIPLLSSGPIETPAAAHAFAICSNEVRYVGVGAMVVGGLAAIWKVRHGIAGAFRELFGNVRSQATTANSDSDAVDSPPEQNLEFGYMVGLSLFCAVVVFGIYFTSWASSLHRYCSTSSLCSSWWGYWLRRTGSQLAETRRLIRTDGAAIDRLESHTKAQSH